jgi:hypothetical protein
MQAEQLKCVQNLRFTNDGLINLLKSFCYENLFELRTLVWEKNGRGLCLIVVILLFLLGPSLLLPLWLQVVQNL